jgi:hypothetical protein
MRLKTLVRPVFLMTAALLAPALGVSIAQSKPGKAAEAGKGAKPPVVKKTTGAEKAMPIALTLKLDKQTYRPTDPIKMTLTVKNTRKETVTLEFSSGQRYDFEIRRGKDGKGEIVWQWARGRMFAQMLTSTKLEPGKTLSFTETATKERIGPARWTPLTLAAGVYTVTAKLTTMGLAPAPSVTKTITVR